MRTRSCDASRSIAVDQRCETTLDESVRGHRVALPEASARQRLDAAPRQEIGLASLWTNSENAKLPPEVFLG